MPQPGSEWPPKHLECVHDDIVKWSAWWGGDPEILSRVYGGTWRPTEDSWSRQTWAQRGGLLGSMRRFFWGQPTPIGQQNMKIHVPLPAEIAQVSADLLFGQPPTITATTSTTAADGTVTKQVDKVTQERIDALLGEQAHTVFHEAAESAAALGHVYLRVGWDRDIDPDSPILFAVDADAAYPVYRYGRLVEVTFVREWQDSGGVLRHLEHHERGMIWHAVYLGDRDNLGRPVDLGAHPETADLIQDGMVADDTRPGAGVATGIDRLDVVGVSNARSRTWRHVPIARDLGRADISGVESELDALDDVWSSWMRDIRHGRSRLHVPAHMLETRGKGQGATVDLDRELYVGLQSPPDGPLQLTPTQFAIRYQEHSATALALIERIVSGAGYSPQTFGLDSENALTATESWARQVRTQNTRNAKVRRWRQALIELTRLMLDVDRAQFGGRSNPDLVPEVEFAETVSESQLARAQTAAQLRAARAASTQTLVQWQHPDWDETAVMEEVARIEREESASAPDPMELFDRLPNGDRRPDGDEPDGDEPDPEQDDDEEATAA